MGTAEFGHQTERKRRRLARLAAGGLILALAVISAYRLASPPEKKPAAAPQNLPSNVDKLQSGFSFTRSDNGRQVFTVHAARTTAFKGGDETLLKDVWVEVFGRTGNHLNLIRTQSCNYNRETGELYADGKVEIQLNAPPGTQPGASPTEFEDLASGPPGRAASAFGDRRTVYLETSHLTFIQQGALVTSDAPVRFRLGDAWGTAQGLEYATRDDWMELKKEVVIEMQPRSAKGPAAPLRLEASRLRYEKTNGMVTLGGPVVVTGQNRRVAAASGRVFLNAQNQVTSAELEGAVKGQGPSGKGEFQASAERVRAEFDPRSMQLRLLRAEQNFQAESKSPDKILQMSADRCRVNFSGKPSHPVDGDAEGNVRLSSQTPPGAPATVPGNSAAGLQAARQDLATEGLKFSFQPGGETLHHAATAGPGTIVLVPRDSHVGLRKISAASFEMDFDPQGRPATLHGLGQAHVVFLPSPGAAAGTPDAATFSDQLLATFDPSGRALRTVDQTGNFRFQQGEQRGFATRASYDAQTEVVTLTGHPRVQDAQTHLAADRILINTDDSTAEGLGHVQATHLGHLGKTSAEKQGDPVFVVADRVRAVRQSQYVHYQGHVRMWRGPDVIESETLNVFKAERQVRSGSRVLTTFLQSSAGLGKTAAASRQAGHSDAPVTILADDLQYSEEGRVASYRGNVALHTQDTTLHSDQLDVFFSPPNGKGESEVERAVARGHVVVTQPARRATGERAEYLAGPGKILVTGGPPALYDAEKGFTTGRQLTFFLRDDTIFLDGGEESPTLSKHLIPQ